MKISRNWLQAFFDTPLPRAEALSDALTFHVFEIDGIEERGDDAILDVKVTANRGHDCLSYRGIAKEISAILNIPLKAYTPAMPLTDIAGQTADIVSVSIDDPRCHRYIAGYLRGVKVGPSPQWLVAYLEKMGQKSINNIVDATNFVMFNIGQPLHAFDAGKLTQKDGRYAISVRAAREGESLLALDGKEYALTPNIMVINDAHADIAIGVAGVKGGMPASITPDTKDIIIESASFDGVSVRKAAQYMKLRTDASARFEQGMSPEWPVYAMRDVVLLIQQIAGGEVAGFTDAYPVKQEIKPVSVTLAQINAVLGVSLSASDVADVFTRLALPFTEDSDTFTVTPPFERLDLVIPEDLIEEVGRIIGYDKVPAVQLPAFTGSVEIKPSFYWTEKIRELLISQGFYEVFTSVFSKEVGTRTIANKIDGIRPYLRKDLIPGITEAFKKNLPQMDFLGLPEIKIFEIGYVWPQDMSERLGFVCIIGGNGKIDDYQSLRDKISNQLTTLLRPATGKEITIEHTASQGTHKFAIAYGLLPENGNDYTQLSTSIYGDLPISVATRYQPYSKYPVIVRDIAMWTPVGTDPESVMTLIRSQAGELLQRIALFDTFTKADKTSLAFRLIFQSFEKTLTDEEVNQIMQKVSESLTTQGFEIR
jgi:phenylalanyl-tRNA synthetase beta chain